MTILGGRKKSIPKNTKENSLAQVVSSLNAQAKPEDDSLKQGKAMYNDAFLKEPLPMQNKNSIPDIVAENMLRKSNEVIKNEEQRLIGG